MKNLMVIFLAVAACILMANVAAATPFPNRVATDFYATVNNGIPTANFNNDAVPDIYDAFNQLGGLGFTNNEQVDPFFQNSVADNIWTQLNGDVVLIGLTAGNANTLGVYTDLGVGNVQTPVIGPFSGFGFLGNGTTIPYPAASVGLGTGTQFGWYLNSVSGTSSTDWFSEPGLNSAGFEHMMTFDLPFLNNQTVQVDFSGGPVPFTFTDPFLIAWEDLPWNGTTLGDDDYDDMMYIFDKVAPVVPDASIMLLLGSSLLGLVGLRKFRKK
jgi:hypothetical protein